MSRRALVVGLGVHVRDFLEAIRSAFEEEQQAPALRTLWLQSPLNNAESCSDGIHSYHLSLDHARLSQLYYADSTRLWSSANWRNWGPQLAENRMLGKLAAYDHLGEIKRRVEKLMAELAQGSSQKLNFYLVVPLADPFASGAMLDIAYLLHDIALDRGARTYGLLLLPGTAEDELTGRNDQQTRLLQATAYAALRELHFLSGPQSFYNNWHSQPDVRFNDVRDASPFQTGDAYLLGGRSDEHQQTLDYAQLRWQAARFVLYQTTTVLGQRLPSSKPNESLFSSLGLAQSEEQEALLEDPTVRAELALIVRQVIGQPNDTSAAFDAERWLKLDRRSLDYTTINSHLSGMSEVVRQATRYNLAQVLKNSDLRYQQAITKLEAFFESLSQANERALSETRPALQWEDRPTAAANQTAFGDLIQQGETTLHGLRAAHQNVGVEFRERRKALSEEIRQLRQQAETSIAKLRQTRSRYTFVAQSLGPQEWLVGGLLSLWLALSLWLTLSGGLLIVSLVVLSIAAPVVVVLRLWYRQQRLEAFANEWGKAQRNALQDQQNMFEKLYELAYLSKLEQAFQTDWRDPQNPHQTHLDALIASLEAIQPVDAPSPRSLSNIDWPVLRAEMLTALRQARQAQQHIDQAWLVNQANRLGVLQNAARQTNHARQRAHRLHSQLGSLVCFREALAKQHVESYQELSFTLYHGWGTLEALHSDEIDVHSQGKERQVTAVRLVCGIPLRALCNLDDWHRSYRASCLTGDNPPLERRALLHPTRLGLIASDILVEGWPMALRGWSHVALLMTLFLRLFAPKYAADLAVSWNILSRDSDEQLFYDELCGQLQQEPDLLVKWLERARREPCVREELQALKTKLSQQLPRPVSESWSEWESWACRWAIDALAQESTLIVLCGLHQICVRLDAGHEG